MTRDEWADRLAARASDAERIGATAPVAAVLRDVLAEFETVDGIASATPDEMLTLGETATRLNVPQRWLTEHRHELPFLRQYIPGGTVRVSSKGISATGSASPKCQRMGVGVPEDQRQYCISKHVFGGSGWLKKSG